MSGGAGETALPAGFADLQPFVRQWACATAQARLGRRLDSTAEERRAFYGALAPRAEAVTTYLNKRDMDGLPAEDERLFQLLLALAEVSLTEEVYAQEDRLGIAANNRLIRVQKEIDGR